MQNKIQLDPKAQNKAAFKEHADFIRKMQKIMRLEDWDIRLSFETESETGEDVVKGIQIADHRPIATIYVNCESDSVNDKPEENTIHEMAHIWLDRLARFAYKLCRDETEKYMIKDMIEFATDNIARAIWNAYKEE